MEALKAINTLKGDSICLFVALAEKYCRCPGSLLSSSVCVCVFVCCLSLVVKVDFFFFQCVRELFVFVRCPFRRSSSVAEFKLRGV